LDFRVRKIESAAIGRVWGMGELPKHLLIGTRSVVLFRKAKSDGSGLKRKDFDFDQKT
jgi:hypothetical protein